MQTSDTLSIVKALLIYFFEGRMFSRWIVTKITSARGTLHCRKTRIPYGDLLVIGRLYLPTSLNGVVAQNIDVLNDVWNTSFTDIKQHC
jgi:hypothetical protein